MLPSPELAGLERAVHGGPDYDELRALGISPEEVLDFSSNINPFGPPPHLRKALTSACLSRYPDSRATRLREALAQWLGLSPEHVLVGSGSTELVRLAALAYLSRGDRALIVEPAFGEYEVACRLVGAEVVKLGMREEPGGFRLDVDEAVELLRHCQPKALFLSNPNNPTGYYLSREETEALLDASGECLLVLDEAYILFVQGAWPSTSLLDRGNVLVLRSLTKDYALPGLRLGYALGHPKLLDPLVRACPPWNVNAVAQEAGVLVLEEERFLEESLRKMRRARAYLIAELQRLGLEPLPSAAPFFLVKVGNAAALRRSLLSRGLLVRDCASFGLPDYVRLSPQALPACRKLMAALQAEPGITTIQPGKAEAR